MILTVMLLLLISMSVFRSPAVALMPDITPKPLRAKANGIINIMGYFGGAFATVLGIFLVLSKKAPYRDPKIDYVAESARKSLRRWIMFAVNDPKWEIQATNLETGEVLQSESLKLSA